MTKIIYKTDTSQTKIRVIEEDNKRILISGMSQYQSGVDLINIRNHIFDYSLVAMYFLKFIPDISKVSNILIVGLGGGTIARELSYYFEDLKIDIIEIDMEMKRVAEDYFFFKDSDNIHIYEGDAFNVVKEIDKKYDVILLDAFNDTYIPYHLMTVEFFKNISSILNESGVIASNLSEVHPSFYNHIHTFYNVFGDKLYELRGPNNPACFYLYVSDNDPVYETNLPLKYYPKLQPVKIEVTERITSKKIFSLKF